MVSITAAVLNHMIYRYLLQSGFEHTAFNFRHEARINISSINGNLVPPAALVYLVQLGIQYKEKEANAKNGPDDEFCLLQLSDLVTKDVFELQQIVKRKKENRNVAAGGTKKTDKGKEATVKDKNGNQKVAIGVNVSQLQQIVRPNKETSNSDKGKEAATSSRGQGRTNLIEEEAWPEVKRPRSIRRLVKKYQ